MYHHYFFTVFPQLQFCKVSFFGVTDVATLTPSLCLFRLPFCPSTPQTRSTALLGPEQSCDLKLLQEQTACLWTRWSEGTAHIRSCRSPFVSRIRVHDGVRAYVRVCVCFLALMSLCPIHRVPDTYLSQCSKKPLKCSNEVARVVLSFVYLCSEISCMRFDK